MKGNDSTPITEPGVYDDITDADYHADPVKGGSLSSTGARKLLPPSCPAKFRWWRDNPPEHKPQWDIGHAAHRLVLGTGPELVEVPFDNWRTKAAQEARDGAYESGAVPLLSREFDMVRAMAAALHDHPTAAQLFDPNVGRPEVTLVWRDDRTGVMCRARFDWLPDRGPWRLIIPDYKTAHCADIDAISRACVDWGYHIQDAWYEAGARALGLADEDAAFVLVVQEKDPPYLVHVVEPDHVARRIGAVKNRQALDVYAWCTKTGRWPGYASQDEAGNDEITQLHLPRWYETQEGE